MKYPPLAVLREVLVFVLEATVKEARRRRMLEIVCHKCEFVGEMVIVQQAQRRLCLLRYNRIEQILVVYMVARLLPADLLTHSATVLMWGYISGLTENWLFAPQSFNLRKEAWAYVAVLPGTFQFCPTLRASSSTRAAGPGAQVTSPQCNRCFRGEVPLPAGRWIICIPWPSGARDSKKWTPFSVMRPCAATASRINAWGGVVVYWSSTRLISASASGLTGIVCMSWSASDLHIFPVLFS
ncbi:hypothetical protein DVF53_23355 [Salmonella enterica subsp. enterica serovar Kottbus]|nr:hypothetical protein [Salmonella enterica subsp. enterica serovar Kottbus]